MTAKRSCLIVDDDHTICAVASIALANEGFACETASNAHEAEKLIARHHFDVLITDLRMPGKNGHALSVEVAAKPLGPMIVVFTGCHEPRLAKDLLKRGVDWNAPDFCTRGYESMGWVTGNRVSLSSSSSRVLLERRRSRSGSSTRGGELGGGLVAQAAVRSLVVVLLLASAGEPPRLGQVGELLAVQQLVAQPAEERFRKAVLPRDCPARCTASPGPPARHDDGSPWR